MRYMRSTSDTCLCFDVRYLKLELFVDADLAGDMNSWKSTAIYVFTLGGTAISWGSNSQKIVALSTREVKYVAMIEATKGDDLVADFYEKSWVRNVI